MVVRVFVCCCLVFGGWVGGWGKYIGKCYTGMQRGVCNTKAYITDLPGLLPARTEPNTLMLDCCQRQRGEACI